MKKIIFGFVLGVMAFAGIGYAITVNPASAVTADSNNTALTIPYRDANGQTEGASFSSAFTPFARTKAQFDAITPTAAGQVYFCSDCTEKLLCVSTGTTISGFQRSDSESIGCGTGE